jgi:hypothetical protein
MSSIDYGVAHFYGLYGTVTYATLQSDSLSQSFKLDVEVSDEEGRVITDRLDDLRYESSLSGVLKTGASVPEIGQTLAYNAITYIIKQVDDAGTNNGFRKVTLKLVKYQEIA